MIDIDREAGASVQEQLVEQLRYLIASGHFSVDDTLPSTRALAEQVDVSFHTVRKAYQTLQGEGVVASRPGKGYTVTHRSALSKEERMERGADVARTALQKLIGLGLREHEIDYLVKEQLDMLETTPQGLKLLFVAASQEQAHDCARQVSTHLQRSVEPVTPDALDQHKDADYVFTRHAALRNVMQQLPRANVLGVVTYLAPTVLERVARLLPQDTLGLITRHGSAIQPLTEEVRSHTGFPGQVLAASISEEEARHLRSFIDETDLVLYTPQSRRLLLRLLDEEHPHVELKSVVSPDSLDALQAAIPA